MRVYEVARQYDISSKEIISLLDSKGIAVKSHMSFLDEEAVRIIEKEFSAKTAKVKKEKEEIFPQKPAEETKKHIEKEIPVPEKQKVFESAISGSAIPLKKDVRVEKQGLKATSSLDLQKEKAIQQVSIKKFADQVKTPSLIATDLTIEQFSDQSQLPASQIIVALLKWGIRATKNQIIGKDIVLRLAQLFSIPTVDAVIKKEQKITAKQSKDGVLQERPPVIVVIGHVDHGKTTLLDFIRKTKVAAREKGGITQHLGAYQVDLPAGSLVFLDTPGHEAFIKIRKRGLRVADIAILVVAADDGVQPQTIEAIKVAQEMKTPLVVALNKIDRVPESQLEVVKQQLLQYGVVSEEWGGDVVIVPISAKTGVGVDILLEMISLQAHMLELRADQALPAQGYILESKLEKGRGIIATVILQHGELKKGDYFVCGSTVGHVNSIINTYNQVLEKVTPSIPVQIAGFEKMPGVGDYIAVVSKNDYLQKKTELRKSAVLPGQSSSHARIMDSGPTQEIVRFILKADTNSSREALEDAIEKYFKGQGREAVIVYSGIGMVSESDVELAANTGAIVFALHTKIDSKAATLANQKRVAVHTYDIIYRLLDAIHERFEKKKQVVIERVKIGTATVIKVFQVKKIGEVAGCYINSGKFIKGGIIIAYRGSEKLGEGKIASLQKEKESVSEVRSGFECGIVLEKSQFNFQEQDRIECYAEEERK